MIGRIFSYKGESKYIMNEMFKNYPDVVTPGDLQEMLHIGRNSTYKLLSENQIETIRLGKKYIIPKVNVIKYLTKTP